MLANTVKLINTAHASISEHKRASLENPFSAAVSLLQSVSVLVTVYVSICTFVPVKQVNSKHKRASLEDPYSAVGTAR